MNSFLKNYLLAFSVILSAISVIAIDQDNYWISLLCIFGFILCCMYKVNFDPAHPVTWYLPFLFIYNLSIVMLDIVGIRYTEFYREIIICSWLAILTVGTLLTCCCTKTSIQVSVKSLAKLNPNRVIQNNLLKRLLIFFAVFLCILYNYVNLSLGLLKADTGQIWYFTFFNYYSIILTTVFCVICLESTIFSEHIKWRYYLFLLLLNLFTSLNTGERDMFFSFLATSLLFLFATGWLSKKTIFSTGLVALILIPILGALKSIFIRTEVNIGENNILVSLLSGEFISAGRNLETLLLHNLKWDYFYGTTLFWDIRRVLTPGFSGVNYTSISWFAETFHWREMQVFQGRGFTLIGEGFINFSYIGVVIIFTIISLFLSFLYNRAHKNYWYCIFYFMSVPFFIYAIRADLANIFSPLFKRILLVMVIIALADYLLSKLKQKKLSLR